MQIIIKTKNLELTESLKAFIEKKMASLRRFMKGFEGHALPILGGQQLFDVFVDVMKETTHHRKGNVFKTEARLYIPGKSLFVKNIGDDVMKTIHEVRDELEQEIRRHKDKMIEGPRRQIRKSQNQPQ